MTDTKTEPMTDEAIDNLVSFIKTLELFAAALDVPVSDAARNFLKMSRVLEQSKDQTDLFSKMLQDVKASTKLN